MLLLLLLLITDVAIIERNQRGLQTGEKLTLQEKFLHKKICTYIYLVVVKSYRITLNLTVPSSRDSAGKDGNIKIFN